MPCPSPRGQDCKAAIRLGEGAACHTGMTQCTPCTLAPPAPAPHLCTQLQKARDGRSLHGGARQAVGGDVHRWQVAPAEALQEGCGVARCQQARGAWLIESAARGGESRHSTEVAGANVRRKTPLAQQRRALQQRPRQPRPSHLRWLNGAQVQPGARTLVVRLAHIGPLAALSLSLRLRRLLRGQLEALADGVPAAGQGPGGREPSSACCQRLVRPQAGSRQRPPGRLPQRQHRPHRQGSSSHSTRHFFPGGADTDRTQARGQLRPPTSRSPPWLVPP